MAWRHPAARGDHDGAACRRARMRRRRCPGARGGAARARADEQKVDDAVRPARDLLCEQLVEAAARVGPRGGASAEAASHSGRCRQLPADSDVGRRRSRRSGQRAARARATPPRAARRRPRASRRRRRRCGECRRRCIRGAPRRPGTSRRGAGAPRSSPEAVDRARCGGPSRRRRGRRARPRPASLSARADESDATTRIFTEAVPAGSRRGPQEHLPRSHHGAPRSRRVPGGRRPSAGPSG